MNGTQESRSTLLPSPPTVTLTRAMVWNWWIVALAVLICGGIAIVAGLLRSPEYSASTKLSVGGIDISAPGALSGFATASESLAAGYSRTVDARPVARQVAAKTGIPIDEAQEEVSGTPIKESPIFKVEANANSEGQAVELANAASHALIAYSTRLNQTSPDTARLFAHYRAATERRNEAQQRLAAAVTHAEAVETGAARGEAEAARANLQAASLQVGALHQAYDLSVQGQASTRLIQVISPATSASSDRRSTLLIYAVIGIVIGLLIGAALAFYRETRLSAHFEP